MGRQQQHAIIFLLFHLSFMTIFIDSKPTTSSIQPSQTTSNTTKTSQNNQTDHVIDYLVRYGYLLEKRPSKTNNNIFFSNKPNKTTTKNTTSDSVAYSQKELTIALQEFQQFMKIPVSGTLDQTTINTMKKKRCGVKDKIARDTSKFKMFLTSRGKRKRRELNYFKNKNQYAGGRKQFYYFVNPRPSPRQLYQIYRQLEFAFNAWAGVTNLVFIRGDTQGFSEILIQFVKGYHGDGSPFDGRGNEIGHASASQKAIHFDAEEDWKSNKVRGKFIWEHPYNGTDFIQCAMHEIGHVLGLDHSSQKESVMFPTLRTYPYGNAYELSNEDMKNIKSSYGKCEPDRIDAIFSNKYKDGKTYMIIGPYIYQFNDALRRVEQGWPRTTGIEWYGADFPDEVFWSHDYFMYWFVGDEYYVFSTSQSSPNSRKKIMTSDQGSTIGWIGLKEPAVDAAVLIKETNANNIEEDVVYLFRKDLVYRWEENFNTGKDYLPYGRVASGWPKKISVAFPGLPDDIDTAFTWAYDGRTYFFKGQYFYHWDPATKIAKGLYGVWQWRNLCDIYKCQIPPKTGFYKCQSWDYTKDDCSYCV